MKKVLTLMIICILSLSFYGCKSAEENNVESIGKVSRNVAIPDDLYVLDKFKKQLINEGCQIGTSKEVDYESVGANNAYRFTVDGEFIEIYEYKMNNLSDKAKEIIEDAKNGVFKSNGKENEAVYNDGVLLTGYSGNVKEKVILETFNNLK